MQAEVPDHDFLHYLICDLPLGYPLKTPVAKLLSDAQRRLARRELLHQQARFLDVANQILRRQPSLAYLTAIKHEAVLVAIPTYAAQLVDVVDISFFNDLQQKYLTLRESARKAIDEAAALDCDRLVLLQSEASLIEDARNKVNGAIQAGYTALEPLPPLPPEPSSGHGPLSYLIPIGLFCIAAGFVIPPYDGGMAWGLAGLIVTGGVGASTIRKEHARVMAESATFKAYMLHESYLTLCRKSVALVLALPFEIRKSALVNLPPCLAALEALPQERTALESRYIASVFS